MDLLSKHLLAIWAVEPSTWTLLLFICGCGMWIIRDHLDGIFQTVAIMPLMLFLALLCNHLFVLGEVYPQNKMAEWLVWTIAAGTVGTVGGIGLIATIANLTDDRTKSRPA